MSAIPRPCPNCKEDEGYEITFKNLVPYAALFPLSDSSWEETDVRVISEYDGVPLIDYLNCQSCGFRIDATDEIEAELLQLFGDQILP